MLEVEEIDVHYGKQHVLHDVSLTVKFGEVVALIGPNAAGKSTTLRVLAGLKPETSGSVKLKNHFLGSATIIDRVKLGMVLVPEGRQIFTRFTVHENLLMGAYHRKDRDQTASEVEAIFEMFPRLRERRDQKAGSMSGGEQQMVAIGRGLMAKPEIMLLDEPTLGLAPIIIEELRLSIRKLAHDKGMTILIAEQNAAMALGCADRAYVMESGRIVLQGDATELSEMPQVKQMYLGH
jgi:branched-chain amino acid transport system ATP-binding protein